MPYNVKLAEKVKAYLLNISGIIIEEKKMFGGLAFMINAKMCINVSGERLMCRFNSDREAEVSAKAGYQPMIMRNKKLSGYCYVFPDGFKTRQQLIYWINLCLEYNGLAKSSKMK